MTFWQDTDSNMFKLFQPNWAVDLARVLLAFSCLLTYPLPFYSLRELLTLSVSEATEPRTPILTRIFRPGTRMTSQMRSEVEEQGLIWSGAHRRPSHAVFHHWYLIPGEEAQLVGWVHFAYTASLYFVSLYLALYARSLGDVLNIVGCATVSA